MKKAGAEKASSVHQTQKEPEKGAKEIVQNLGGEVHIQRKSGTFRIQTQCRMAMIQILRATADTDNLLSLSGHEL